MSLPRPAALDATSRSCEWLFRSKVPAPWNAPAGTVMRSPNGSRALNIAPLRWLVLGSADDWRASACAAGAVEFDTSGRWRVHEFSRRSPALRAALDVEAAFRQRECLALTLFDTPAILATHDSPELLLVCVPASFSTSFLEQASAIDSRAAQPSSA